MIHEKGCDGLAAEGGSGFSGGWGCERGHGGGFAEGGCVRGHGGGFPLVYVREVSFL
jgi:hypothetical protein